MKLRKAAFAAVALVIVAAACSDDKKAEESTTTAAAVETTAAPASTEAAADVSLKGVCPDPLVIQTDWFPEAEHGAVYELMGEGYTVDTGKKVVTGPLVTGGVDTGIKLEIRTGGPAIGFAAPSAQLYTDSSIHLGYVSTDDAVNSFSKTPTIAVVAPLEINPQMIMWDPATYPEAKTIEDLAKAGVTFNVFGGQTYTDVFVKQGKIPANLVDPSYDGSPQRFISSGGKIAQQGFVSAEPYQYEKEFKDWGKPVAYQLIHDAGFQIYSQPLAIRADDKAALDGCLKKFVPMVQQAAIDYVGNPAKANSIIIDAVAQYKDFWVYGQGVADFSVAKQKELGLIGNGPDATLGNFDLARVQTAIDQMKDAGFEVPATLTAETIVTNEYIDPSIGL